MRVWRVARVSATVIAALALSAAAGAGAASASVPNVCMAHARAGIAQRLGLQTSAVTTTLTMGTNGMPQCTYKTHKATVIVNVDSGPQAAWRLMRTLVEAQQIFGPEPPGWKPPIGQNGLGPYAAWFPELDALMVTNGKDLIDASVSWSRAKRPAMISLGRAAVTPYERDRHRIG